MKFSKLMLVLATTLLLGACGGEKAKEIVIEPDGNKLEFKQKELRVKSGETVKIILNNTATIPIMKHNFVILKTEAAINEVGQASATEADGIAEENPNILAYTPVADIGEKVEVVFTAPAPGIYPYICSTMGHYITMKGRLIVE